MQKSSAFHKQKSFIKPYKPVVRPDECLSKVRSIIEKNLKEVFNQLDQLQLSYEDSYGQKDLQQPLEDESMWLNNEDKEALIEMALGQHGARKDAKLLDILSVSFKEPTENI